ncbi:MAG: M20/M25/M40 family metallo-hydrolase [Candidatus Aminicenantia bacterium]
MLYLRNDVKRSVFSLFLIFFLFSSFLNFLQAQDQKEKPPYLEIAEKILKKGLRDEQAYAILERLTSIGGRLSGSPQASAAVELMHQKMKDVGLDEVYLEPITVQRWVRGAPEEARIINSTTAGTIPLSICAIGGSIATPKTGITAQVLEVKSFEELKQFGEKAKGKIIFFNRPMDPTFINTFQAYGKAVGQRVRGAVEAAKVGAVAVLVRSLTTRVDDFPHTGLMRYDPQVPKIPAGAISTKSANFLSKILKREPSLNVYMKLNCQNLFPVTSFNVIGQITGSKKPNEIILLGAHLDSWDLGVGAHDDGAGCAQVVEALRLLKELGLKPKRTIRGVLFMNEEFGVTGGRDYANAENRKVEDHLAAIESDRGGFLPLGFSVGGDSSTVKHLQKWEYLFKPLGMYWIHPGGGGADIAPLAKLGTITIGLVPDSQRYFDVHHSAKDVLDAVNPRELELGAIAMAIFAYVLAQEGI